MIKINVFKPLKAIDVYYNTKTKLYPNGATNTIYCNRPIFKSKFHVSQEIEKRIEEKLKQDSENTKLLLDYLEEKQIMDLEEFQKLRKERIKKEKEEKTQKKEPSLEIEVHDDSVKRAKDKVFDIVYLNPWDYFITITFSDEFVNRQSEKEVMKKLISWLRNQVYRKGLKYILVPEYHKNGGIHCHMLCNDVFTMLDSGTKTYKGFKKPMKDSTARFKGLDPGIGRTVYNIKEWKLGFSTAIKCYGNQSQLSYYITKYITKDIKKIFGKYYWSSRNIKRECEIILSDTDYSNVLTEEFEAPNSGGFYRFKYDSSMLYTIGDDNENEAYREASKNSDEILKYLNEKELMK